MYGWQDSYSVGVLAFDKAHQKLFTCFNDFYSALKDHKPQDKIGEILEQTLAYTKQHFDSEEQWLASKNYPDLAVHKEQHRKFQAQIQGLIEDNRAGKIGLSGTVSKTLREWLTGHIMEIDQQYANRYNLKTKAN
jgi:hemerythrin